MFTAMLCDAIATIFFASLSLPPSLPVYIDVISPPRRLRLRIRQPLRRLPAAH